MSPRPNLRFGPPGIALAIGLAALAGSHRAPAQAARSFDLTWDAPADCPTSQEVERDIAKLIGEGAHDRTVKASATVTSADDGWRVRVRMETGGETSERALSAPTCRALEKAVALVIAITIDPRAAAGEPPPRPPPPPPPPPVEEPKPPPAVRETPRPWKLYAMLGPATELGLLPRLGAGGELAFGFKVPLVSAEVAGDVYAPESTTVKGGAGGRFLLVSGGIRACGRLLEGQVALWGCADNFVHRLSAKGFGVTTPGSAATTLVAWGLGPRVDVHFGPTFFLLFQVGASYAPGRANFVLDNVGRVYTATHLGVSGHLGLAAQF